MLEGMVVKFLCDRVNRFGTFVKWGMMSGSTYAIVFRYDTEKLEFVDPTRLEFTKEDVEYFNDLKNNRHRGEGMLNE